jgi:hypothetical protein
VNAVAQRDNSLPSAQRKADGLNLVSILCPQCSTPLARVPRPAARPLAVCLECGLSGDYVTLIEHGALTGGSLPREEIERLRIELGGLRDQAARAEAMDRGD